MLYRLVKDSFIDTEAIGGGVVPIVGSATTFHVDIRPIDQAISFILVLVNNDFVTGPQYQIYSSNGFPLVLYFGYVGIYRNTVASGNLFVFNFPPGTNRMNVIDYSRRVLPLYSDNFGLTIREVGDAVQIIPVEI